MASTAELLITITANSASAVAAISELEQQTRLLEQIMANTAGTVKTTAAETEESSSAWAKLGDQFKGVGQLAVGMATGLLAANLAMSVTERIKTAAEEIDTYGKAVLNVQRISGGSAQAASTLVAIFERYTPSLDDATTRLGKFERALAGQEDTLSVSSPGGKTAAAYLQEFGVTATDANGQLRPTLEILEQLADGFQRSGDAAQKNAALTALFGRGSQSMLLLLNQGSEGLKATAAAAEKYGLTLTGENLNDVYRFGMAHKDLDMALQGVSIQLGAAFMPSITAAAQQTAIFGQTLNTSVMPGIKAIADSAATPVLLGIASASVLLAGAVKILSAVLTPTVALFGVLGAAVYSFSQPLRDSLDTLYTLREAMAGIPADAMNPLQRGVVDLLNKLPDRSAATAAVAETAPIESEDIVPSGVKAATASADTAKVQLQQLQNAAAERKAQFDISSLGDAQKLLDLKSAEIEANATLVESKRQIEDIDRNAVNFAQQRLQLEESRAALLAQQSASPLQNASADIKFQEDEIKAQIRAARAGGPAVNTDALRSQLHDLQQQDRRAEPGLLIAEHNVTLANRAKAATDLDANLAANTTAGQKLDVTQAMAPADAAAVVARRALEDQQHIVDLEKQRFELTEKGFAAEIALAAAREKGAASALFVVQHPEVFPTYGPARVSGILPQAAEPSFPAPNAPITAPLNTGGQDKMSVTVNIGDVTHGGHADDLLQEVISRVTIAWNAALQGVPVAGALGGAFSGGSAPR